jgi:hypothetical protein
MNMNRLTLGALLSFSAATANAAITLNSGLADPMPLHAGTAFLPLSLAAVLMCTLPVVYALAAAGRIARPPLLENAVYAISALYLLRGLFLVPQLFGHNIFSSRYTVETGDLLLSSLVLLIAIFHLLGIEALHTAALAGKAANAVSESSGVQAGS